MPSSDPPPLRLTDLVAELAWLQRLARHLVADASTAETLSQEVVLRAVEHRPRGVVSLRGWLRRVLVRQAAANRRREDLRRRGESQLARPEAQPPTVDLCARVELQRTVVEEVLALPEAQRDVVLRRFFDGQPPREIAADLGIGIETVKSRLQRGLARLRERLGRRFGEGTGWKLALAPLTFPPGSPPIAVAGSPQSPTVPTPPSQTLTPQLLQAPTLTTFAMMTKSNLAIPAGLLALGLLGLAGLSIFGSSPSDPGDPKTTRLAAAAEDDDSPERDDQERGAQPATTDGDGQRRALPDKTIRVAVRDAQGQPAIGIPIRVDQLLPDLPATMLRGAGYQVLWRGTTTGPDGIAVLPPELPWADEAVGARVFADIHAVDPQAVTFRRDSPPTRPIELELPPLAAVEVRIVAPGGQPIDPPGTVSILLKDGQRKTATIPDLPLWRSQPRPLVDGVARFPSVETGLAIRIVASLDLVGGSYSRSRFESTAETPATAGSTRRIDLTRNLTTLRGRVLAPDGEPLRDTAIHVFPRARWDRASFGGRRLDVRTDREGILRLHAAWSADDDDQPDDATLLLRAKIRGDQDGSQPGPWCFVSSVESASAGDLGDLRLRALENLRWGTVLDPPAATDPGAAPPKLALSLQFRSAGHWAHLSGSVQPQADATGRFWILPQEGKGRYRLRVSCGDLHSSWQEFDATIPDPLQVRLHSGGQIRFRFTADNAIDTAAIYLVVDRDRRSTFDFAKAVPASKERTCASLPDGTYRVRLMLGRQVLHEVPQAEIRDEERVDLPLTGPLDLRGALQTYHWTLRAGRDADADADWTKSTIGIVTRDEANQEQVHYVPADGTGAIRFTLPRPTRPTRLEVRGFQPLALSSPSLRETFQLLPSLVLHASVPDKTLVPDPPEYLTLIVTDTKGESCARYVDTDRVSRLEGQITCQMPGPGRYRLQWVAGIMHAQQEGGFATPHTEAIGEERTMDLKRDTEFVLPLTATDHRAAQERLRKRLKR